MTAITREETRARLVSDKQRLLAALTEAGEAKPHLWLHPSWQAVWLHRWSHFHFYNGRRLLARLYWHINLMLTGADISPIANLGPGLLIASPVATILLGRFGANLTVVGHGGVGGGISREDIGGGPGLPFGGDDITIGFAATILGPVRIGDGVVIGPRCLVTRDVAAGAQIVFTEPKQVRGTAESEHA